MNIKKDQRLESFRRLLDIMDDLRENCPWDRKQTMESLRNLTIEETYELADAILNQDMNEIKEEIGDIMLHMVFYSKIAAEENAFTITEVLDGISDKLVKRHPHIYGDTKVKDAEEVKKNWEQLKQQEGKKSVLSGVPNSLPAMIKAYRMQDKTAQVGFEWETKADVWAKVEEEILEFKEVEEVDNTKAEEEFGDLLFSLINYARFADIDPETALEKTNRKFKSRFEYIESHATKPMNDMSLDDMDELWELSKLGE